MYNVVKSHKEFTGLNLKIKKFNVILIYANNKLWSICVVYIQSDKLSIWSIGLPPPLFNDQFLHSETNAKVFFISRYEFIKWLFCTEKGIIMHALTIRHFYIMCHHLFYARRKVIISFWSYFINEWMLFLWMVSVWNRLCIFYFFFFMWGWSKV